MKTARYPLSKLIIIFLFVSFLNISHVISALIWSSTLLVRVLELLFSKSIEIMLTSGRAVSVFYFAKPNKPI